MSAQPPPRELRLIAYSAGNFGKNLVWSAAEVTLLYVLTAVMRVPATAAGWIVLAALVGDAALGVLVGAMLAHTPRPALASRFALIAAPVCGGAFALLYAVPTIGAPIVAVASALVFRAAYAFLDVPHNMMMTRVSDDSRARSRVAGYRFLFATLGALVVAGVLLPALSAEMDRDAWRTLMWFGIGGGIAIAIITAGAVAAVGRRLGRGQAPVGLVAGLLPPTTPPLASLYAIGLVTGLTVPMFARLLLFDTGSLRTLEATPATILTALTIGQFAGVVAWTWLASRYERVSALALSHATVAVVCAILAIQALSGERLASPTAVTLCVFLGIGLAGVFSLPWAALCATIDLVEHRSGERREPQAFAYMLAALKIGAAIGTAAIAWSLSWAGYVPGQPHDPAVRNVIAVGNTVVPMIGSILCLLWCRRLQLGHVDHRRIMTDLAARRAAG